MVKDDVKKVRPGMDWIEKFGCKIVEKHCLESQQKKKN